MSSILQELEKEIANVTASVQKSNVGVVREVGDGVHHVDDAGFPARFRSGDDVHAVGNRDHFAE